MLARAVSLSALARGFAAVTLCTAAKAVHRDAFSRTPPPPAALLPRAANAAPMIDAPTITVPAGTAATAIMRDECLTASAGANAAFECGDLRLVHPLPTTTTMAKARTPALIYNSRHENGVTLIPLDVYLPPGTVSDFTATVILRNGLGVQQAQSPAIAWSAWTSPATRRITIPINTRSLPTNAYYYSVAVDFRKTDGTMFEIATKSMIAIVNRSESPFGRGWWLDGLEQLVPYDDTQKLWVGGDGSTRLYTQSPAQPAVWTVTPAVDRPDTLEQVSLNVWRRHLRNGAYVQFDSKGRHTFTVDRSGHKTAFSYASSGHPMLLTSIQLPIPPKSPLVGNPPRYQFSYAGFTSLSGIDAPPIGDQTRHVGVVRDAIGGTTITDPDGRSVRFDDPAGLRIVRRTDKRGFSTSFDYEAVGYTLISSTLEMKGTASQDITTHFSAAEQAGVGGTAAVDASDVETTVTDPRFTAPQWTRFGINPIRAVTWVRNMLGEQTTLRRSDPRFPAVVTSVTRPNGFTTVATYNDRGLVAFVTDSVPWAGLNSISPITRYRWSVGKFDVLDAIVHPAGDSIMFGYLSNGDRQWEQLGSSTTRRVKYRYGASRQLRAVVSPGNNANTEVDSVEYDDILGNVSRTLTPLRIATRYHTDPIGRIDSVYSPGASGTQRVTSTAYDLMDRPVLQVDVGPKTNYSIGGSYLPAPISDTTGAGTTHVQHYYDAVGNDTLVERWATPNPTNIPLRQIYAHFDGDNRKVLEMSASGSVRQWQYDPAGNIVAMITPRRDTIRMQYDVLNRLTQKITPAVRYEAMQVGDGPTPLISASFPNFAPGYSHDWHVRDDPMPPPLIIPGDTTSFTYDSSGGITSAVNHDILISRAYYRDGTMQNDVESFRSLTFPDAASPYNAHIFSVGHLANVNGQISARLINAPGNCGSGSCRQTNTYDQDTGELVAIQDDTDVTVQIDRQPKLRTVTTRAFGSSHSGALSVEQFVQRDADGRAIARRAGPLGDPVFTDVLTYDSANRVANSVTSFTVDAQRSMAVDNVYTSLGALAAQIRTRASVSSQDTYETDAFANVSAHSARNLTDNRGAVVNAYGYTTADRQLSAVMTPTDWRPETPPIDVLEETSETTFDAAGNRVFFQKSLQKYDRDRHEYGPANYGLEWNWNAYDAEDRLRVSQRSFFSDSVTLRTVFVEYSYDALGRRVQTRTRWDMHCQPDAHGACHPSVERTIWDGNEIVQEMRSGAYDIIPESANETDPCVDGSDWSTKPWCAPDYVPPPVPVRYVQSGLDLESTPGNFEGVVRYVNGESIDEPVVVRKSDLGTFVPLRSTRGLVEDGLFIDGGTPGVNWTARDIDVYGARDMLAAEPLEPTHWLGSFIGDRRDAAGLVYMRNRYYDPSAGRFTQEDPIGLAGGMNLYGFAGGDPVNFADPFGLCKEGVASNGAHGLGNTVVIECADGTNEVRSGGSRSWRNNNPGNLEQGPFSKRHGSIGAAGGKSNDRFAVFSDLESGQGARAALLGGPSYAGLSIADGIAKYAPGFENNVPAYVKAALEGTGVTGDTKLGDLSASQMDALLTAMRRHEGFKEGTVNYVRRDP